MKDKINDSIVVASLVGTAVVLATLALAHVPIGIHFAPQHKPEATEIPAKELIEAQLPLLGTSSANLKIVMFGDYECPPCRNEWPKIESFFLNHQSVAAVYFRHFPLFAIHPLALDAAIVSEQAKKTGYYLPAHKMLYSQPLSSQLMAQTIHAFHINRQSLADISLKKSVIDDFNLAKDVGATGTPTVFVVRDNQVFKLADLGELETFL